jgi:hypothetical protein
VFSLKHIGAYFLLLVYSVSFAHQIIPHHHHENNDEHEHHLVEIHDHCVAEEVTHNHVAHEDHFDEGLIDYLACVLGNHEHNSATECEFLEASNAQKKTGKSSKVAASNTLIAFNNDVHFELVDSKTESHLEISFPKDPLSENRGKRGPPQA